MADPLSLAAGITTLVIKAFTASSAIHSQIHQIKNAPEHIKSLASDLEDFYSILGSLRGYLEDPDMSSGILEAAEKVNINGVIDNCLLILTRIGILVNSYNTQSQRQGAGHMGMWKKLKYSFKMAETTDLKNEMLAHKVTLNMTISLANFININSANNAA